MCVVPYYNKPPQEGLYQHFKTIADSTELPVILYNIPGRCVINMTAETTLRLANDCENVVAVKEASGDIEQVRAIVAGAPEGFSVYSGDDSFADEDSFSDDNERYTRLRQLMLSEGITPLCAYAYLIFILLYFPCIATIAAIRNETGSWRWAVFAAAYTTVVAWVASALVYQIGSLLI